MFFITDPALLHSVDIGKMKTKRHNICALCLQKKVNIIKYTCMHRKYYFALIRTLLVSAFAEHSLGGRNRTLGAFSYFTQSEKYKFAGDFCTRKYKHSAHTRAHLCVKVKVHLKLFP